jgi:ribosome biogenesis protein Tsr3
MMIWKDAVVSSPRFHISIHSETQRKITKTPVEIAANPVDFGTGHLLNTVHKPELE